MNEIAEIDDMENPIESSKEPKTPIQEPTKKVYRNLNFRFQVNPASKLKQALETLTDADFNPDGLGFIEVEEKGLEITVRNPNMEVLGHLWLKSSGLINFEFKNAMINKMINLQCILDNLVDASADDTVTLLHLHCSSQLNFMFVSMSITAQILTVHLVGDLTWRMYEKGNGIREMEPDTMHCAWFQMHHHRSLNKASFIAKGLLLLCLVTDPPKPEQIMFRFNLRELGDLVFVSKAGFIAFDATFDDYCTCLLRHWSFASSPKLR